VTIPPEHAFADYLSRLQLEKIAARAAGSEDPSYERRPGAVLFIDASGFTELTNRFAARGDVGVEELSELVNAYFGRITDLVIDHGGDVIGFAGDSALAVWPVGAPDRLEDATLRAVECAHAVQRSLAGYEPQPGVSLALRASIGAGTLTLVELGGVEDRWHLLVAGDPVRQAVRADRLAAPGDIVLSPPAWELVRDRCRGILLDGGGARLTALVTAAGRADLAPVSERPPPALLLPYLPRIVVERLRAGQERWLGEFRSVSALFVDLAGMEINESENVSRLHEAVGSTERALRRHDGVIHHLLVDDKGTTLIGLFGLPPLAHADDASRCVHAALDVREAMGGAEVSIGVSTGLAFCGVYGAPRRRQYTVLGPVMHRAARLMQGARGSLFCDEASAGAAASQATLVFDHLPPIRVKGEAAPVMVYGPRRVPTAERAPGRPRGAIVGRMRERAMLERSLAKLLDEGTGDVFLISGDEAIGKSMVVEHLVAEAREAGALCLMGAGSETEQGAPYHPWRRVLKELLEIETPNGGDLAPLLGAILPLGLSDTPLTRSMEGEVRAENTRQLVADRLRRASAARPTLLVIEDVQWADSASWALLLEVARQVQSLLLVVTARPMTEPPELHRLREIQRFHGIELGRFTREEVRRLMRDRLDDRNVPDAVVDLVHERAEGHPFFAEELTHALSESGALAKMEKLPPGTSRDQAETVVGDTAIPDTIRGVILKRLDRLTPEQQLVLRLASVIGHHFDPRLLAAIHPAPSDAIAIERLLEALEDLDLVRPESAEPGARAVFRNRITREVVYHSMLFEQRRELHRKIAEWYEASDAPATRRYALLGHHWKGAGDAGRASGWLANAGEQALHEHANRDAVRFLTEALELSGKTRSGREERARWHLLLGRAHVNLSGYEEALAHFEEGLSRFGHKAPRSAVRALPALVGQVAVQGLHRLWPDRFLGRRSGQGDLIRLIHAHEGLVEAHYASGRAIPTLLFMVRSLNLAETVGPSGALARSYASAGAILGFVPLRGAAEGYSRRALETARGTEDPAADAWVSLATGVYKAGIGAWDEAVELLERVRVISQRLGDRRRWEDATQHLATVAYLRGEYPRALELARHLHTTAAGKADRTAELDAPWGSEAHPIRQASALPIEVACLLRLGSVHDLPARIEEIRHLVRASGEAFGTRGWLVLGSMEAQWSLRRGRYDEARAIVEATVRDFPFPAVTSYESLLEYWAMAEALLAGIEAPGTLSGSSDAVERRLIHTLAAHARVFPVCRPAVEIARGLLSRARGRSGADREALRRGARAAEALGMPWFEATARYHLGRSLGAGDPDRVAELERAYATYERLGSSYDLELVRREGVGPRPAGTGVAP